MMKLSPHQKAIITVTVLNNKYIPHKPFLNQILFLTDSSEELLYGGQAGGGKSDALLMAALQFVNDPDYSALLLRRTYKDLSLPGAIMSRSHEWLEKFKPDVHWDGVNKIWTFPSGATLTFGYLNHDNDVYQYQGAEFQFVGFDELTQFTESQYNYLHSRLRKLEDSDVPIRMRAGSNPGGVGHEWVKERFINGDQPFISSSYTDNIHLNTEEYGKALDKLDNLTRQQLKFGDWDAVLRQGLLMDRDTFYQRIIRVPRNLTPAYNVIGVDLASTGDDYTAALSIVVYNDGSRVIMDSLMTQSAYPEEALKEFIRRQCEKYRTYAVEIEKEPGSNSHYSFKYWQDVLGELRSKYGFILRNPSPFDSKFNRIRPLALAVRDNELLINEGLPYKDVLCNQFIYAHPDKKIMEKNPSPDLADAGGYAYNNLRQVMNGGTRVRGGRV